MATPDGDPKLSGSYSLLVLVTDVNFNTLVIDEFPSSVGVLEVRQSNFYVIFHIRHCLALMKKDF